MNIKLTLRPVLFIPPKIGGTLTKLNYPHETREIVFSRGCQLAVVLASFYGGKGYTTHRSVKAVIKKVHSIKGYAHEVVDKAGNTYEVHLHELLLNGNLFEDI